MDVVGEGNTETYSEELQNLFFSHLKLGPFFHYNNVHYYVVKTIFKLITPININLVGPSGYDFDIPIALKFVHQFPSKFLFGVYHRPSNSC